MDLNVNLKDLRTFQKLAQLGNMHSAATALGVTQPALSKAVRRLETHFGVRLFERTARGVALTAMGRALYARNLTLTQLVDDIRVELDDLRSGQSGLLRVGTVPALVDAVVAPALVAMRAGQPAVAFQVQVQLSNALLRELTAGRLDLVLCAVQDDVPPELACSLLGTQSSHVVAREGHPLFRTRASVAGLADYEWVLPPRDVGLRAWVEQMFTAAGLPGPRLLIEADASPVVFASVVRASDALTVLTADSLCNPIAAGIRPLPQPVPNWNLSMALFWRRAAYVSAPMRACRDELGRRFGARTAEADLRRLQRRQGGAPRA